MFKPVSKKVNFPQIEEGVLAYWAEGDVFKKPLARNVGAQCYTFYNGSPFMTGLSHYGHLLTGRDQGYCQQVGYNVDLNWLI